MTPAVSAITKDLTGNFLYTEFQDLLQTFRTQAGITAGPVGLTVMRTRIHVGSVGFNGTNLPSNEIVLGVRVFDRDEAIQAEAGPAGNWAVPTDPHADWMAVEYMSPQGGSSTAFLLDHHIDVKSMRKIDELGQTLGMVVSNVPPNDGATTGGSININVSTSVLLALP